MNSSIFYPAISSAVVAILALFFNKEMKENDYTKDWINSFSSATSEFISHLVQRNRAQKELIEISGKLASPLLNRGTDEYNKYIERWERAREDLEKKLYNHLTELIKQESLIKMLLSSSNNIKKEKKTLLIQQIEQSEEWLLGSSLSIDAEEICMVSSEIIEDEWIRIKKHGPVHNLVNLVVILTLLIVFISLFKK
ncbi:hypothetical protein [Tatumella ptyseos]|uniref:hypothetical protein n=1 Tax=Tatumella ptyseos TaxID=82987 RepID=UPI0023F2BC19|nr:hypothetical protein [Tatumella ptyseos]